MDYSRVLKLPQYFRNLQRLTEIATVLVKHGFGDLLQRMKLASYVGNKLNFTSSPRENYQIDFNVRLRLVFEELGPTFIKFGQIISTRPDIFSESIIREFRKLQDKVPPFPSEKAKERIEGELQKPLEEIFSTFDMTPIAAASIAQVHRATLVSGKDVIVKVLRPNIEKIIETDIEILLGFAALLEENIPESRSMSPSKLVEEFARTLKKECDFSRELLSIRTFSRNFVTEPDVIIPQVFPEVSSKRVLVEEFVDGVRADELQKLVMQGTSPKFITDLLAKVVLKSIFEDRFFHADPHPGNILVTRNGKLAFVDFGAMGRIDKERLLAIVRFLLAVFAKDVNRVVRVLYENQMTTLNVDEVLLKNQVIEIIDHHLEKSVGEIDFTGLIGEIFEVVRFHGIKPPADLLLVGKVISTLESIAATLDPEYNPLETIYPFLVRWYVRQTSDPRSHLRHLSNLSDSYHRLISDFPVEAGAIIRNLARDKLTFRVSSTNIEENSSFWNKVANRAIMAFISVALVTLGLVVLFNAEDSSSRLTASYFLLMLGSLSLFLVWRSIRRSGGIS